MSDHEIQSPGKTESLQLRMPPNSMEAESSVLGGLKWIDVEKLITDEMLRLTALMKRDRGDGREAIMPIWTSLNVIRHRIQAGRRAASKASLPGGKG